MPKPGTSEHREYALADIFRFYSRQHFRNNIRFEEQSKVERMQKGELIRFCKDFGINIPQSKMLHVFAKVSQNQSPLVLDQFKQALPLLALEMATQKALEIKLRLRELKAVLDFPDNSQELPQSIVHILKTGANVKKRDYLQESIKMVKAKVPFIDSSAVNIEPVPLKIKELIPRDEYPQELAKSELIKKEIEKFMVSKKFMAYQETTVLSRPKLIKQS